VERGWGAVERVLTNPQPINFYPAGSWGPQEADRIAAPWRWHNPDGEV